MRCACYTPLVPPAQHSRTAITEASPRARDWWHNRTPARLRAPGRSEVKWKSLSHGRLFIWTPCPWNSPGQNTGMGSLSLLQGIFPTQGSNLDCRRILYQLSHQGSPASGLGRAGQVWTSNSLHSIHTSSNVGSWYSEKVFPEKGKAI